MGDTLISTHRWGYDKCLRRLLESLQHENVAVSVSFKEFSHVYFGVRERLYRASEQSLKEVGLQQRLVETLRQLDCPIEHGTPVLTRALEAFFQAFIEDVRIEAFTPKLLHTLKRRHKLGLVSNFAYAPGFWRVLEYFTLASFFHSNVVSGVLGFRKPHPSIFREVLEALDVTAAEAVLVGDSLKADIYGAKRLGFKTVLVENVGLRKNPMRSLANSNPSR